MSLSQALNQFAQNLGRYRLLHQFDEPSPTRHYIVNSFLDNSVKCGIYF